jgi:hypothetical protein
METALGDNVTSVGLEINLICVCWGASRMILLRPNEDSTFNMNKWVWHQMFEEQQTSNGFNLHKGISS